MFIQKTLKIISNYISKYKNIDFILVVSKSTGEFYMVIDQKKYIIVGVFIQVTQQVFFKKSSAMKVGLYDINYKYHADYDYFYRLIAQHKMRGIATKKSNNRNFSSSRFFEYNKF